jgi:hypothetical protein
MLSSSLKSICCLLLLTSICSAQKVDIKKQKAIPVGKVTINVEEPLLQSVLDALFSFEANPSVPLSRSAITGCPSEIQLIREIAGVKSSVRFREGKIIAPIAFRGAYYATLLGCITFEGTASTRTTLSFDKNRQAMIARLQVTNVNLEGVPVLLKGVVTNLVQNSIDARVNPTEVLKLEQVSSRVPVPSKVGLQLRAAEIVPEIIESRLTLHISYEIVQVR